MAASIAFLVLTETCAHDCDAVLNEIKRAKKPADEVIVLTRADQVAKITPVDRSWFRIVGIPDASVFMLRAHIPTLSRNDWLVVLEEHSLVTSATLEAIRNTIENKSDIDLIPFLGKNLTSVSPWGWANFLHTFALIWAPVSGPPQFSSVTSTVVRRAALGTDSALEAGEWEDHTIPRIFASGKFAYSNEIYVDHVRHLTMGSCVLINYHNARSCAAFGRKLGRSALKIVREGWSIFIKRPSRLARARAERWSELPQGTLLRLHAVGLAHFIGYFVGTFFGPGQSPHKIE